MTNPTIGALHAKAAPALCYWERSEGPDHSKEITNGCNGEDEVAKKGWNAKYASWVMTLKPEGETKKANGEKDTKRTRSKDSKICVHVGAVS